MGRSDAPLDVALRFLAARPRSEQELRRRFARAHVSETDAEVVLALLRQRGLVDDAAFARYWVEQRRTFRPRGARLLAAELRGHGIAAAQASAATRELAEPEQARHAAYRAAAAHARRLRGLDERAFQQRLGGFLSRRGFDWETITSVVEQHWREHSS